MSAARDDRDVAGGATGRPWAFGPGGGSSRPWPSAPTGPEPDGYETAGYSSGPLGTGRYDDADDADDADAADAAVFDIADDRREDGNSMTYPSGRAPTGGYPFDSGPAPAPPPGMPVTAPPPPPPPPPAAPESPAAPTTAMAMPAAPDGVGLPAPREAGPVSNDVHDMVAIIRSSFAAVAPRSDEITQLFYGWLFRIAPETRELFPVTMELQRTRFLRGLLHVVQTVDRPDELSIFLRQLGRDHRKFGVVREHYDKVGEALVGALGEISGELWTREVEQAWLGAYDLVAQTMLEAAAAERGPAVWMGRVMEHRRLSQDLAVVRVQTSEPVPYLAGQYVSIETPQRPRMWRSMSPANAPGRDCVLEFHVCTVPGGWVSRAIVAHAQVGDVWRIGPPMGQMTLDPRSQADLLMVAGGTGLAPARAIVEQLIHEGTDRKVCLFLGGRTWDDLYDVEALRRLAQENPWLTVVPVVEDDGRSHGAETGTVGQVVARYGAWADRAVMIAGSPAMVRATTSAMLDAGTPFRNIHYDPYHTD